MCKRVLVLLLIAALASAAGAANIYVNAAATAGGNTGADWANAYLNLQSALPGASGDVIHVAEGIYKPGTATTSTFAPASGVTMLGGYNKENPALFARNPKTYRTLLDADVNGDDIIYDFLHYPDSSAMETAAAAGGERADNNQHLISINAKSNVTVDGFICKGGTALGGSYTGGGGIYVYGSSTGIVIRNCELYDNYAWINCSGGGGVYINESAVDVSDCLFIRNGTNEARGAAISISGRYSTNTVNVIRCTFLQNYNWGGGHGIVAFDFRFTGTIKDCLFVENHGVPRSMMYNRSAYTDNSTLDISNCVFHDNLFSFGGTLYNYNQATTGSGAFNIKNCLFTKNTSDGVGTGLTIFQRAASTFALSITNCTFANNEDNVSGYPGIYVSVDPTTPRNPTTLTIKNNIIWGNKGFDGNASFGGWDPNVAGTLTVSYNCLDTTDPNNYIPGGSVGNLMADPKFVDPNANDYHLQTSSPCIDKGNPADAFANEPARVNGCRINIGAYGNTAEAAVSTGHAALSADSDNNCVVDLSDLSNLRLQWLKTYP